MNYVNHFRSLERQFGPAGEYSIVEAMKFYVLEDRMPTHDADRCRCYWYFVKVSSAAKVGEVQMVLTIHKPFVNMLQHLLLCNPNAKRP